MPETEKKGFCSLSGKEVNPESSCEHGEQVI
jgi:hypothetical protein